HLHLWGDMLRKYEGIEPEVLFGDKMTVEFKFDENKEYVRNVLAKQKDLRILDGSYAPADELPADWPSNAYRERVLADGAPSERIVNQMNDEGKAPERPGDELLERAREVALRERALPRRR